LQGKLAAWLFSQPICRPASCPILSVRRAQVVADAVRSHWAVENALHWSLDVGFREDASQVCKDNAPANLAVIRRIALTQIKQDKTLKLGVQGKRRTAGWDLDYLETVLGMFRI
jgi:hypothetical protein